MRLKLDDLQKVVKKTMDEDRAASTLKTEIARVFGNAVMTEGKIESVVASANDWLDVLDRTGRSGRLSFEPSVTTAFLNHSHPEIRKFAARVCPEKFLVQMVNDRSPEIRAAVAHRVPLNAIREMIKRFPKDDQLRSIFRVKKNLLESGVAKPEERPIGFDPTESDPSDGGTNAYGDAIRTQDDGLDLSEAWYKQQAMKMLHDYGRNIESAWQELAVARFCRSAKATSCMEIDEKKLLKNIKDLIEEKEELTMERESLKETLAYLERQEANENLREGFLPKITEELDPVQELMRENLTGEQFCAKASQLFRVQQAILPMSLRKYRIAERTTKQTPVPCIGLLPHKFGFRAVDERALDKFCESWSARQQIEGEPIVCRWSPHPENINKISFTCSLK